MDKNSDKPPKETHIHQKVAGYFNSQTSKYRADTNIT